MKCKFGVWFGNIPFYLIEVFICNLVGHKPMSDLDFYGYTFCNRCYAKVKK